ncbi:MAG: sugar transferase [Bacteroidales bacterium]
MSELIHMDDPLRGKKVYLFLKRLFDIVFSALALVIFSPFLALTALWIYTDSRGPVFFLQERTGRNGKLFRMVKFRTMKRNAHAGGLITIGNRDDRITRAGYYLRKHKLDEWPQLWNILKGEMSFVGPRPEVPTYVITLPSSLKGFLLIRPGLTSYATIAFVNVNEQLAREKYPEKVYREKIMPRKAELNLKYMREMSIPADFSIMLQTARLLFQRF